VLVAAAVTIAAAAARTAFFPPGGPQGRLLEPEYHEEWEKWVASGRRFWGDDGALMKIIEFGDLECPYCARFHQDVLQPFVEHHGDEVQVTFVHLPLRNHRFARPAAIAAECAAQQGRFSSFIELVLEKRDSIGLKTWESYADEAGVEDTTQFAACTANSDSVGLQVDRGLELASGAGISGTPTIVVNGWRLPTPPTLSELESMLDRILSGADPVQVTSIR
jgi:protein-disulfide isomerase